MNFKLTMTLAIILVLLTAVLLYVNMRTPSPTPVGSTTPLLEKPDDIKTIAYSQDGVDQVKFAKTGTTWAMTYPVAAAVESWQLQGLADDLKSLSYRQKFAAEATGAHSPEFTGIANPHNVVKFGDGSKEWTLAIGKRTVDGWFATLNGDTKNIYLIGANLLERLDKNPDDFRDKEIKSVATDQVTGLALRSGDQTVSLNKSGEKWLISAPVSARASATAVDEVLNELRTIRANGFVSALDKAAAGLDPPKLSVTATIEEKAPASMPGIAPATTTASKPAATTVTLELGYYTDLAKKNFVYASLAGSKQVFTLASTSFNKLNRELKDFRDPSVTPAAVTGATEVTISAEGAPAVALSKKDAAWTLTSEPKALGADVGAIDTYLAGLRDLKAINYVDNVGNLKAIGLDPPRVKIELTVPGQSQREVILAGNTEKDVNGGEVTAMMRQGEPTVYQVPVADAKRLNVTHLEFRDRSIERLEADRIRSIAISGPESPGGGAGLTLEREGLHWVVKEGKQAEKTVGADEVKVTSLLADFTPVTAGKYVNDKGASGTPSITVTLSILEASKPATAPATGPATATAPASASAPATRPATMAASAPATSTSKPAILEMLNNPTAIGPDVGKTVTRTLRLYKVQGAATTAPTTAATAPAATWKAVWDEQSPAWTFEPTGMLVEHVTKENYVSAAATQAGTQPSTGPATKP